MPPPPDSTPSAPPVGFYDSTYGRFDDDIYRAIRREVWDEDFGQNGWVSAAEQDWLIDILGIRRGERLLDIACGSGGPTLRIAQRTGAEVMGIDVHADGVAAAQRQVDAMQPRVTASFHVADAAQPLPFAGATFDVLTCIDAINHLPNRQRVLSEWCRVLRPGGRIFFTDPIVITGPVASEELATRSSIGYFLFTPPAVNESLIAKAGLQLLHTDDLTPALDQIASRWWAARASRAADLSRIEGQSQFEGQQRFLHVCAALAREQRLSRIAYTAVRPGT